MRRPGTRSLLFLTVALIAGASLEADADSLEWSIVSSWGLAQELEVHARAGWEVQAVLVDAPDAAVLLARPCCGKRPPVATYRLIDRASAGDVGKLGDSGHHLVAFGPHRAGGATAVFASARGAARGYRSLQGDAATLGDDVASLLGEGWHCAAAAGRTLSAADWLLFEREANASPREGKLLLAPHAAGLGEALATAAREGFSVDCAWSRGSGRFSLGGPTHMAAVVSRVPGAARPVAHTRIELGTTPSGDGTLLAVVPYGSRLAFVQRDDDHDASTREVQWPRGEAAAAWTDRLELERQLRSFFWEPAAAAWVVHDAGKPSRLVALARDERQAAAEPPAALRAPEPLPVPAGATALPGGGEPWAAYQALLAAIRRGDLAAAKAAWTGTVARRWSERVKMFKAPFGLGFSEKDLFKGLPDDLPDDPELVGAWQQGDAARLRVEGTVGGARSTADLDLARESGRWKLADESSWRPLAAK